MSIDAFEKREQMLRLRARVLQAEQERMDCDKINNTHWISPPFVRFPNGFLCDRSKMQGEISAGLSDYSKKIQFFRGS